MYTGLPFVSWNILPIYSPIIPKASNWMPPKNNMTDSRVGKPDTGSPKSIAFMMT